MGICEDKELILENLLSLRKRMTQQEVQQEMMKIGKTLSHLNITKSGPITTAVYSVEQINNEQIMDIEIIIPLGRKVELPSPYKFKQNIKILNALSIRHVGNPSRLGESVNQLNEYIMEHEKQVITATYNVTVKDAMNQEDLDKMIIDIYVGCNPCTT